VRPSVEPLIASDVNDSDEVVKMVLHKSISREQSAVTVSQMVLTSVAITCERNAACRRSALTPVLLRTDLNHRAAQGLRKISLNRLLEAE
jgi:hypothetical protein